MTNFKRHQEVSDIQSETELQNCALLAAYIFGKPGGWFFLCNGSVDGFSNDYALIHSTPGNIECHSVQAVYLNGDELFQSELSEILEDQAAKNGGERPPVETFTDEEKQGAIGALREAAEAEEVEDLEEWLETLCNNSPSDVSFCDWAAVAAEIKPEKNEAQKK
ncbi:MAG: hypothetical protein KGJ13_03500 [Patescibacteria group bacterium]|nr:hypothetical protein [Patescibacteria group bacterium]